MNGQASRASLVETDLIEQALAEHEKRVARLPETAAEVAKTRDAMGDAQLAARAAAFGNGEDPLVTEMLLEDATRRHKVAERVHDAAQHSAAQALAEVEKARGLAWRPVYLDGVRRRIAACRAGEAAKAALAAAEADSKAAWAAMNEARSHGVVGVEYMHTHFDGMRTEAEERHLWLANGFNPDTGKYDGWGA